MQNKLIDDWYIILLLVVFPPAGMFFVLKYRTNWLKRKFFLIVYSVYLFLIGLVLNLTIRGKYA